MAPSVTGTPEHVQTAPDPSANPAPNKKKPRSTALADAKKILRAASAVTSKSLAAPEFVHRPPDIARHRRKCAVCHHSEREIIEDLFIHWHSPNTIAEYYKDDTDGELNWVSIYRHAYAFGLDEVRRRNLRFAFELIIEQAADITATPAAIIASARALGTCVTPDGQWNDPPKRVLVTNVIRNETPQPAPAASASEDHRVTSSTEVKDNGDEAASYRASFPREVVGGDSAFLGAPSFAPSAKGGNSPNSEAAPSSKTEIGAVAPSSYRATHPRDVVSSGSQSAAEELHEQPDASASQSFVGADRLHRPASPPSPDSPVEQPSTHCHSERGCDEHPTRNLLFDNSAEASAAETVGAASRAPSALRSNLRSRPQFGSAFETETDAVAHSSYRALHPRDVVTSPIGSSVEADRVAQSAEKTGMVSKRSSYRALHPRDVVTSQLNSIEPVAVRAEIRNSPNSFKSKEPPISNR